MIHLHLSVYYQIVHRMHRIIRRTDVFGIRQNEKRVHFLLSKSEKIMTFVLSVLFVSERKHSFKIQQQSLGAKDVKHSHIFAAKCVFSPARKGHMIS